MHLDTRVRTRFLLNLPYVPLDMRALLHDMCVEPERCVRLWVIVITMLMGT
jgi:hypothetical protein